MKLRQNSYIEFDFIYSDISKILKHIRITFNNSIEKK